MASISFGPSQSHVPMVRKFGLKNRKPRLKVAQPKSSKLRFKTKSSNAR